MNIGIYDCIEELKICPIKWLLKHKIERKIYELFNIQRKLHIPFKEGGFEKMPYVLTQYFLIIENRINELKNAYSEKVRSESESH